MIHLLLHSIKNKTNTMDLFEQPELLPAEVQAILNGYDCDSDTYHECNRVNNALAPLGYSFSWGLDGQPYDLTFNPATCRN